MTTLADANVTLTRTDIRRQVSDLLGDLTVCVATANGSTTTFVDADHCSGPSSAFAGREAYFTGGTAGNLGKTRYVSASSTAGVLTVATLPSATALGDEIELRNLRSTGWRVDEIHRAINRALADANNGFWSPAQETLGALYDRTTTTLTIPNAYSHLYNVEYLDTSGYWHAIEGAHEDDEPGWRVVRGQRVLVIGGWWGDCANGQSIRITGYKRFAPLTADTDTTTVNGEWLGYQVAAYLLMQGAERMGDGSRNQKYLTYQSRADRLRDLVNGPPANGTQAVL